ncbi:Ser-tRNA(Thr) hydrolase [Sulfolobus acidocaldarius SUSAZ]|nr:Ser-tRNA(Thr) hydrolase [Sulfolobus acidocaldarius SUSAZ]
MIILLIHASKFSFSIKDKAIREPEEPTTSSLEKENVLVAFTTVEKGDDEKIVERAAKEIGKVFSDVKASSIIIYPYAHLSDNLEKPDIAVKILRQLEEETKKVTIEVSRAPFGWYKQFYINCYGHPLSELSKRIRHEEDYEKSEEIKVCEKFGFPSSPHSVFMRNATIEYLKKLFKPNFITEGDGIPEEGEFRIIYSSTQGRRLPCVNEEPKIKVRIKNGIDGIIEKFEDSKNSYVVANRTKDYMEIDVNLLTYYFLYNASTKAPPMLPLWMNPIQVRILPVKSDYLQDAFKIASYIKARVDIDDINDNLGSKIARAGKEWIPFIVLLGEREVKTGSLTIKLREKNEQRSYTIDELNEEIKRGDPLMLPSTLPLQLSKRSKKNITLQ